ncbi:sulfatase-like hydrolase/transferase [Actinomycetaceae bacterium MB13-C1-2]|nr:sulfatase-like hydrolase/transferase [Actinomycetaceae bacterium MB13-C1-2]
MTLGKTLVWLLILAGAIAFALGRWVVRTFGHITLDQAIMNLDGAGEGGGKEFVYEAILEALVVPIILVISLWLIVRVIRNSLRKHDSSSTVRRVAYVLPALVLAAVPLAGAWSLGSALQVRQYIASRDPSLDLADHYVLPQLQESNDDSPTNLVLIYLESIENTFGDDEVFEINMLESIQEATADWDYIDPLEQYPGGGWTMSGIVSTQCGIPLRMPPSAGIEGTETLDHSSELNRMTTSSYLAGTTCLGDVLQEQGYKNVFMGGADASFASKGQYFTQHGYSEFLDRKYWEQQGETEFTESWGLSDSRLLENAKAELAKLESEGEPFSLTVLTLDTHEPAPRFASCEQRSEYPLVDATRCSMDAVADFLSFASRQGYLEDTTFVVMGDHLKFITTGESLGADFTDYENRSIFNRIESPVAGEIRLKTVDQFDMFPTILEAMGFALTDGRAGLGVSAYNASTPPGSLHQLSSEEREALIRSRSSDFFASMWAE